MTDNLTGPRIYVQRPDGEQGYLISGPEEVNGKPHQARVAFFRTTGLLTRQYPMEQLTIIPGSRVERCPNRQTRDECGSGENQCETCLQAEDAEGDEIEKSMGLR